PQTRTLTQAPAQPTQPVHGHRLQRRPAVVERFAGAADRVGKSSRATDGGERATDIGAQRAARGVYHEDRLQRTDVPGQPQVADPPLAADHDGPLIEAEIGVAAARGEDGLDGLDLAEYRAEQVEPLHTPVPARLASPP